MKYSGGDKKGQLVAPDIEAWFQKDQFGGKPGIVAQWADAHNTVAQNWVGSTFDDKNPTPQQQYVLDWEKSHADVVTKFKTDNPDNQDPAPADLAVVFFETFSKENPGKFPSAVTKTGADGKSTTAIEPIADGSDIQSTFFDMWLSEHPDVELQQVPADMVMASGSGLDPDITLDNALYQLDRVAGAWGKTTGKDASQVRGEIEKLLRDSATSRWVEASACRWSTCSKRTWSSGHTSTRSSRVLSIAIWASTTSPPANSRAFRLFGPPLSCILHPSRRASCRTGSTAKNAVWRIALIDRHLQPSGSAGTPRAYYSATRRRT